MKLLFDQNLSYQLPDMLKDIYPDSQQVRLIGLEYAEDTRIWEYALQNNFMIVTQDADFYELSLLKGAPPKIIWLRCGNQPTAYVAELLRKHTQEIAMFAMDDNLACTEIY